MASETNLPLPEGENPTELTLDQMHEAVLDQAADVLLHEGELMHSLYLYGTVGGAVLAMPEIPAPGEQRHTFFRKLGGYASQQLRSRIGGLRGLLDVSEAWMGNEASYDKYKEIAQDPDRVEVLLVVAYDPLEDRTLSSVSLMERDEAGTLTGITTKGELGGDSAAANPEHRGFKAMLLESFYEGYREGEEF